jgi:adenylate cyclase
VHKQTGVRAFVVGAAFAALAAATSAIPIGWNWQEGGDLYALFAARGPRPAPDDVVLVPIDRLAASRIFLPQPSADYERCRDVVLDKGLPGYRNPDPPDVLTRWPRCLHGRVLDTLARAQPDAIVMDISFRPRSDPSGIYAEQDRALAASIRRAGAVLLALKIGGSSEADHAQPIASEIERAALAQAPFLVLGDQLKRADKFCTFKEDDGWSGPCLPTVAHQLASLKVYPRFRALLERAAPRDMDLMPVRAEALLAEGALQAPVRLMRHLATSDPRTSERLSELLGSAEPGAEAGRLRSLADIYLGPGIRYFNFYGPPGAFRTLRYESLVVADAAAAPAAGSLRGKVVFIGFAEQARPETSEHFVTPFTRESIKLSGVELAATAYSNLEDGSAIEPAPRAWRGAIALALGIVFTLLGIVLVPKGVLIGSVAILALAGAYFAVALVVFERFALWLPVTPLGFDVLGGFAAGFVELKRMRTEAERKTEHIVGVLRAMLPERVVERIVGQNQKLADLRESVLGTCVITDLQGFTALFKTRTPDEVARMLDRYFDTLFPVVKGMGGNPIDVLGDSMLAVWHARAPDPAVREEACLAALQLAEAAERFRDAQSDEGFRTRIGVEYGEMTMGMVGAAASHLEYRPVGVPVNAASRLQERCKALDTRILVTGSVIGGTQRFLVRDLGHFRLRDVPDHVHVYELIAERARATPAQLALCERFGAALAHYQANRQPEARRGFAELAGEGDGPSKFYLRHCEAGRYFGQAAIPQELA